MSPELAQKLTEKYPKIFDLGAKTNFSYWGFEVDDGWYRIIDTLCHLAQWHIDQSEESAARNKEYNQIAEQVKAGDLSKFTQRYSHMYPDRRDAILAEMLNEPVRSEQPVPQMVAIQVKEKFGSLRFYYRGGDLYIRALTDMAEAMSHYTCETCGNPGEIDDENDWLKCRCKEHQK